MATLPPDSFADSHTADGPPSLSNLPMLTEEVQLDASQALPANSSALLAAASAVQEDLAAQEETQGEIKPTVDPAYMQQFLAQTIDDALVLAIQQSMPRFIAQVRTQVAATVQRRLREEIERLQRS